VDEDGHYNIVTAEGKKFLPATPTRAGGNRHIFSVPFSVVALSVYCTNYPFETKPKTFCS